MSEGPISRPRAMTDEQVQQILDAIKSKGGSITYQDPRVSQMQSWILSCVGIVLLGLGGWLVNSINNLNATMQRVVTTNEYTAKMLDDHARRIEALEREYHK